MGPLNSMLFQVGDWSNTSVKSSITITVVIWIQFLRRFEADSHHHKWCRSSHVLSSKTSCNTDETTSLAVGHLSRAMWNARMGHTSSTSFWLYRVFDAIESLWHWTLKRLSETCTEKHDTSDHEKSFLGLKLTVIWNQRHIVKVKLRVTWSQKRTQISGHWTNVDFHFSLIGHGCVISIRFKRLTSFTLFFVWFILSTLVSITRSWVATYQDWGRTGSRQNFHRGQSRMSRGLQICILERIEECSKFLLPVMGRRRLRHPTSDCCSSICRTICWALLSHCLLLKLSSVMLNKCEQR